MKSVVRSGMSYRAYRGVDVKSAHHEIIEMESIRESLDELLGSLNSIKGVKASAIASSDGLIISSRCPQTFQDNIFATMTAAMIKSAEGATTSLKEPPPERLILETKRSKMIVRRAGPKALLSVLIDAEANLGLILLEIDTTAEKVARLL